jgi:hypothetical protein
MTEYEPIRKPALTAVDPRYPAPEPIDTEELPAFAIDYGRTLPEAARDESFIIAGHEDLDRVFKNYEDSGWRMSDEEFNALPNKYDIEQLTALKESVSEEERDDLMGEFDEALNRREFLASHGWKGTAAQIGATLLDPTLWGATVGAEVGGVALVGAQLTRVGRLLRTLGAAGVSESAMIGIRAKAENDYSEEDMAFDFIAALTITGALEGALGKSAADAVKAREDDTIRNVLDTQGYKDVKLHIELEDVPDVAAAKKELVDTLKAELIADSSNKLTRGERKSLRSERHQIASEIANLNSQKAEVTGSTQKGNHKVLKARKDAVRELNESIARLEENINIIDTKLSDDVIKSEAEADLSRIEQGIIPKRFEARYDSEMQAVRMAIKETEAVNAEAVTKNAEIDAYNSNLENEVPAGSGGLRDAGAAERSLDAGRGRIDDYGRRINSGNSELASFAQTHLQDPLKGGSDSTAVKAKIRRESGISKLNTAFNDLWQNHKETSGNYSKLNPIENVRQRGQLSEKVWEAVVTGADHGPEVQKVANEIIAQNKKLLEDAVGVELGGFDLDMVNPRYMKQEWKSEQWLNMKKAGATDDEMAELIERGLYGMDEDDLLESIAKKQDELATLQKVKAVAKESGEASAKDALQKELDEMVAIRDARKRLAIGFNARMLGRSDGSGISVTDLLDDESGLKAWLRAVPENATKSEEELEAIIKKALTPNRKNNGDVVDRAKKRINIDPTASLVTKAGKEIRVADLMNKDAIGLQQSYINSMSGHIAFAENGVKRPSDLKAIRSSIYQSEASKSNKSGVVDSEAKGTASKLVDQFDGDVREIYGLPRYDLSSKGNRIVSLLLKYNFTRFMGMAAFSALGEMGRIVVENGMRNTLKTITSLDGLFSDSLRVINKNDHVVREINGFGAAIGDEQLVRLFNSFDENGILEGTHTNGLLNKAEIVAHRGAQIMSRLSALAPVDKALRLLSFSSSTNNLYAHLVNGKKSRLPMEQMGLTANQLDSIKAEMIKHTKANKLGHVEKLGIENWPLETSSAFMQALTINGARQVQQAIAGEGVALTSHPVARVFLQFRKFSIDSYSKHLRADMGDFKKDPTRIMLSTMLASIFSGLAYYTRVLTAATGMDERDRKAYLDDKLSPERVVANALNYTPNLGVGVTAWNATGGTLIDDLAIPVNRSTGFTTDVTGSPAGDFLKDLSGLLHNVDDSDSKNIIKKGRKFLPFQNTAPVNAALNAAEAATN